MEKQTTKAKTGPKRGALAAPVQITETEPVKKARTNGSKVGGLANYKQQRSRKKPFTKVEQELIDSWRAIFAAMEKEEEKAKA